MIKDFFMLPNPCILLTSLSAAYWAVFNPCKNKQELFISKQIKEDLRLKKLETYMNILHGREEGALNSFKLNYSINQLTDFSAKFSTSLISIVALYALGVRSLKFFAFTLISPALKLTAIALDLLGQKERPDSNEWKKLVDIVDYTADLKQEFNWFCIAVVNNALADLPTKTKERNFINFSKFLLVNIFPSINLLNIKDSEVKDSIAEFVNKFNDLQDSVDELHEKNKNYEEEVWIGKKRDVQFFARESIEKFPGFYKASSQEKVHGQIAQEKICKVILPEEAAHAEPSISKIVESNSSGVVVNYSNSLVKFLYTGAF